MIRVYTPDITPGLVRGYAYTVVRHQPASRDGLWRPLLLDMESWDEHALLWLPEYIHPVV